MYTVGLKMRKKCHFVQWAKSCIFEKKFQMELLKRGLIDLKKKLIMFITVFTVGSSLGPRNHESRVHINFFRYHHDKCRNEIF